MTDLVLETAAQARDRDRYTIEAEGIPSAVLMENAARALCALLETRLVPQDRILILCGPGNNGQDGLAMCRILQEHGILARAFAANPDSPQGKILKKRGISVITDPDQALALADRADWIVDAMFGSGLSRPLSGIWETLAKAVSESSARVLAVDVPSGIHGTDGPLGETIVRADLTGSLGTRKIGTILPDALPYVGEESTLAIGLGDPGDIREIFCLTEERAVTALGKRPDSGYKGTFGKALVIGGSASMHGAVSMTAQACFRSGIGLLTVAVPDCLKEAMRVKTDSVMLHVADGDSERFDEQAIPGILHLADGMDVISIGNGMGREPGTAALTRSLLATDKTLVLDADALSVLDPAWLKRTAPVILTPHWGEFSRMTGLDVRTIRRNPVEAARAFVRRYPACVLVLKGEITVVAAQNTCHVLCRPDSALAKGGSGDVLCGIITGLAGSHDPLSAALAGVWAHNHAAAGSDPVSFTPQDLIGKLTEVWKQLAG